jgi:hypothetical protein
VPAIFIFCALSIAVHQMITNWQSAAWGIGLVLIGLPVYYLWTRTRRGRHETHGDAE